MKREAWRVKFTFHVSRFTPFTSNQLNKRKIMNFNDYLETKDAVYGVFTKTNDPFFIEILGRAGFDFVIFKD